MAPTGARRVGSRRPVPLGAALAVGASACLPTSVAAQACLGVGSVGGQAFLAVRAGIEAEAWTPGGTIGYDTSGPATVFAAFDRRIVEDTDLALSTLTGNAAVELLGEGASICAVALAGYQRLSTDNPNLPLEGAQDGFVFGGGLSIGNRFENRGGLAIIPRAAASVLHTRAGGTDLGAPAAGGRTFARLEGGVTVAKGHIFVGPGVLIDTLEGSDVVFTGTLGIVF